MYVQHTLYMLSFFPGSDIVLTVNMEVKNVKKHLKKKLKIALNQNALWIVNSGTSQIFRFLLTTIKFVKKSNAKFFPYLKSPVFSSQHYYKFLNSMIFKYFEFIEYFDDVK